MWEPQQQWLGRISKQRGQSEGSRVGRATREKIFLRDKKNANFEEGESNNNGALHLLGAGSSPVSTKLFCYFFTHRFETTNLVAAVIGRVSVDERRFVSASKCLLSVSGQTVRQLWAFSHVMLQLRINKCSLQSAFPLR